MHIFYLKICLAYNKYDLFSKYNKLNKKGDKTYNKIVARS